MKRNIISIAGLAEGAKHLRLELDSRLLSLFAAYQDHLLSWNSRVNLISRADEARIVTHHFLDSLSALPFLDLPPRPVVLDLGSGAGFPGLPLKIVLPQMRIVLLDSKRKRFRFLLSVVHRLALPETRPICERAEVLAGDPEHRAYYHAVLVRGVPDLPMLVRLAWPLLRPGGVLITYKGPDVSEEIAAIRRHRLRASIANIHSFAVPPEIDRITGKSRIIVRIHKA